MSVKERNTKLLLATVTYIAIIETVMCITHCRKYCIIATGTPTCIVTINIATHIFATEIVTYISSGETSNCVIATETVTFITATKRSTTFIRVSGTGVLL